MYRPFLFITIFFVLGIINGSITEFNFIINFIIAIISFFCLIITKNVDKKKLFFGFIIFCLGTLYFNFWTKNMMGNVHQYIDTGQLKVAGYIYRPPTVRKNKVTYDIKTLYVDKGSKYRVRGNIRISTLVDNKSQVYNFGDVVEARGTLKMPASRRNFGGFDYKSYLFQKGITASMFSREINKIGTVRLNPISQLSFTAREKIVGFFNTNLPKNASALLSGLVLGIKGDMSRKVLSDFEDTGLMHLLAVSGLHVGVLYKIFQEFFYYIELPLKFSFFLQSLLIIFYCILSGLTPSVVRATIMILVMLLSNMTLRRYNSLNSLCFAALIILLRNPLSLFSISFQLSFCATLGIIIFYGFFENYLSKLPKFFRESIAAGISAQLLVWPFLAYYFNKISIVGILSTPIVAPLTGIVLILGFVSALMSFCFIPLGEILVKISGFIILMVEKIVGFFARIPFSYIIIPQIDPFIIFIYFILLAFGIKMILKNQSAKIVKYTAIFVIILILIVAFVYEDNTVEITFIDVGQGDSIFIRTDNNKTILVDGGGLSSDYYETFDIGRDVIKPFLYAKGVRNIDIMLITHFDIDHVQGLLSLMDEMPVGMILYGKSDNSELYKEMVEIAKNKQIKVVEIGREDKFYIGNVLFEVLHPSKEKNTNYTANDSSVVIKLTCRQATFLLTGDLEHLGEKEILESVTNVQADVLKLGHHGSKTSTSKKFLDSVDPKIAVISVGKDNNFGHPSSEILNLLKSKDIKVLRTDIQGGITFKIDDKGVKIWTTIP